MREKILTLLNEVESKKLAISEIKELLDIKSSDDFKKIIKEMNKLEDEALVIESNNHEYSLIRYTDFVVGHLDLKEKGFGFVMPIDPQVDEPLP